MSIFPPRTIPLCGGVAVGRGGFSAHGAEAGRCGQRPLQRDDRVRKIPPPPRAVPLPLTRAARARSARSIVRSRSLFVGAIEIARGRHIWRPSTEESARRGRKTTPAKTAFRRETTKLLGSTLCSPTPGSGAYFQPSWRSLNTTLRTGSGSATHTQGRCASLGNSRANMPASSRTGVRISPV